MSELAKCKAVIIIFAMDGCHHCEDFQPRFEAQLKRFQDGGVPIAYYTGGAISRGVIPVILLDGASADPQISGLADQHQIDGMPTTLLLTRSFWGGSAVAKFEGAIDDRQIYDLLVSAVWANR